MEEEIHVTYYKRILSKARQNTAVAMLLLVAGLLVIIIGVQSVSLWRSGKNVTFKQVAFHPQMRHIEQLQTDARAVDDRISNIETFFTIIKINKNKILLEDKRAMLGELRTLAMLNEVLKRDIIDYHTDGAIRWSPLRLRAVEETVAQAAMTTAAVDQFVRTTEYMMVSGSKKNDLLQLIDENINRIHTSIKAIQTVTY